MVVEGVSGYGAGSVGEGANAPRVQVVGVIEPGKTYVVRCDGDTWQDDTVQDIGMLLRQLAPDSRFIILSPDSTIDGVNESGDEAALVLAADLLNDREEQIRHLEDDNARLRHELAARGITHALGDSRG
jgi:hypothetical protein